MAKASEQMTPAERAALEARYEAWFWRTFDEDRLDCIPVPAEIAPLERYRRA
jgi:hypothetical protein